jgi:DDE superfamily endonuclease
MRYFRVLSWHGTAVSLMLGVARHPQRGRETAVLDTLSPAGGRPQSVMGAGAEAAPQPPDAAQAADAIGRFLALREFRARLYGCFTARADALFELTDAILCADHAVTSLVQLSLEAEFTRGHGALYDALASGEIGEEALAGLLAETLPQLIDGGQG